MQAIAPWQVGAVFLGAYEVLEYLGSGCMGSVHRVRHKRWAVDLAVKSPSLGALSGGIDAFVREAETWAKLGLHPHVVECFFVQTIDERVPPGAAMGA